ncbi:MAG: hypothetical protein JWM30_29 [Burkholderia sp.]|nr:hypothetical protein [Burkholderia sp.]
MIITAAVTDQNIKWARRAESEKLRMKDGGEQRNAQFSKPRIPLPGDSIDLYCQLKGAKPCPLTQNYRKTRTPPILAKAENPPGASGAHGTDDTQGTQSGNACRLTIHRIRTGIPDSPP